MNNQIFAHGAEAIIIKEKKNLIKRRIKKGYRIAQIDEKLRKQRTKKEACLIEKASLVISVPKITKYSKYEIELELIKGEKLSDSLDSLLNNLEVCNKIGQNIAKLHDINIIHGDLTTSNMLLKQDKIFFIDFGLGFTSNRVENKAVDLHVLKEALEAKHFLISKNCWNAVLEGYKISKNSSYVLKRLEKVEQRGRYKAQY